MRDSEREQLDFFCYLAETLHFGRAAAAFFISPASATRNIQLLEEDLGVMLFNRSRKSVELTSAGEAYYKYAKDALRQYESIKHQLQARTGRLSGTVMLSASATGTSGMLTPMLEGFRTKHPHIMMNMMLTRVGGIFDNLLEGSAQIVLTSRDRVPKGVVKLPVAELPLVLIHHKSYPFDLNRLDRAKYIFHQHGNISNLTTEWFFKRELTPDIYPNVVGLTAVINLAVLGYGVGVVPDMVYDNSPFREQLVKVDGIADLPRVPVSLFTRQEYLKDPAVAAVWEWLDHTRGTLVC